MKSFARFALASMVSTFTTAAAFAHVLVVDKIGIGTFTDIQAAVDAAAERDTILVKSGIYDTFSVTNKSLFITGDAFSTVRIDGAIRVWNLAADKLLVLANLQSTGIGTTVETAYGLYLNHDDGRVRVQNCDLEGARVPSTFPGDYLGYAGVSATDCADLSLTNCVIAAGSPSFSAASGLEAQHSSVTLYDCMLAGTIGQDGTNNDGGYGGDGSSVHSSSFLFASRSAFMAGDGGQGACNCCGFCGGSYGGDGGDGVRADATSSASLLNCSLDAGAAGAMANCCTPGPFCDCYFPGSPGHAQSGNVTVFSGIGGTLHPPPPVRENTQLSLVFDGRPGDHVHLLIARTAAYQFIPSEEGVLLLASPMRRLDFGVLPATGRFTRSIPIFDLDPVLDSVTLQLQATFTTPQGEVVLGSPGSLVVLSDNF
jgi:hypothetical protein